MLESCHFFPLALFDDVVRDTVGMLSLRDLLVTLKIIQTKRVFGSFDHLCQIKLGSVK